MQGLRVCLTRSKESHTQTGDITLRGVKDAGDILRASERKNRSPRKDSIAEIRFLSNNNRLRKTIEYFIY